MTEPDGKRFDELFDEHWPKVVSLAYRLVRDADEAKDIAQETFLLVHRGLPSYRAEGHVVAWILKIALHVALKAKARRKKRAVAPSHELDAVAAPAPSDTGLSDRIARAMDALPEEQRVVLSLFAVQGLAHAEIAAVLGIPEGTVWSRLHLARKKLRERLETTR